MSVHETEHQARHGVGHEAVPGEFGRRPRRKGGGRGGRGGRGEQPVVPDATFSSYYGRPVIKKPTWKWDIAAYLFLGGLAGGSSLLGAGADLTDRPTLRRATRVTALGALGASFGFLVHDLGRPDRFHHMLRVAKPTSPMSMGTWILTAYGPAAGVAAVSEVADSLPLPRWTQRLLRRAGRPAGLVAAGVAPALASYTAVLFADTAVPAWHEAYEELPFVFVGSAAAAAGGLGMLASPVAEAAPARRMAVAGAALELAAAHRMEGRLGLVGEPYRTGDGGDYMRMARHLTTVGAALCGLLGRRSRLAAAAGGACLLAGSVCTRWGVFHAGLQSAADPKYTVVPQRERLAGEGRVRAPGSP